MRIFVMERLWQGVSCEDIFDERSVTMGEL